MTPRSTKPHLADQNNILDVFLAFLKLGLTSFGGPIAHIGYFRNEFVTRRNWLSENQYSEIVALCQFLPGPTSSQVGFLIGMSRGGPAGAFLAWLGFTTPSAIAMMACAFGAVHVDGLYGQALIHGLKLVAVVIVAQAVWEMSRTLTPDRIRIAIALLSAAAILISANPVFQLVSIIIGSVFGIALCRTVPSPHEHKLNSPISQIAGACALLTFFILLFTFATFSNQFPIISFVAKFYQSGSLVFGGGHVVLPLLEQEFVVSGQVEKGLFLAGYGATQAMPGPLFTFASYLGVLASNGPRGIIGGVIATFMIFLPGLLLVIAVIPFWARWRENATFRSAVTGANAAVVGVLGAALYDPIWTSSVTRLSDLIFAIAGFALLTIWRIPSWAIVIMLPSASVIQMLVQA